MILPAVIPLSARIDANLKKHGFDIKRGAFRVKKPVWHRHRGVEIMVVHNGTARLYAAGWHATARSGQGLITYANHPHGTQGEFDRTVIHFDTPLLQQNHCNMLHKLLTSSTPRTFHLSWDAIRRLVWVAQELEHIQRQSGSPDVAEALIGLALTEIHEGMNQQQAGGDDLFDTIVQYMHEHIDASETITTLAERFGHSRSYISQLFMERTGTPPAAYWLAIRLEHACRLLSARHSVERVAHTVGFQSVRGFQRAFRRQYGMSPSDYRRMLGSH